METIIEASCGRQIFRFLEEAKTIEKSTFKIYNAKIWRLEIRKALFHPKFCEKSSVRALAVRFLRQSYSTSRLHEFSLTGNTKNNRNLESLHPKLCRQRNNEVSPDTPFCVLAFTVSVPQ